MWSLSTIISLIALIVASISAFSSYRTSKIAKEKLRFDLYNRRFDIYNKVLKYALIFTFDATYHSRKSSYYKLKENFIIAYRESTFLFKENVSGLIFKIMHVTGELSHYYEKPDDEKKDFTEFFKMDLKARSIDGMLIELENTMKEYLQFDSLSGITSLATSLKKHLNKLNLRFYNRKIIHKFLKFLFIIILIFAFLYLKHNYILWSSMLSK